MALASFALTAGSAVTSYMGASETAQTTNLANRITRQNAIADFGRQEAALGKRQAQEADAASAKKFDVSLDAQKARATNAVAAGESGIAGPTVDSLMRDIYAQEGRYNTRVDTNLDWTNDQIQEQKKGASYAMKDRINSLRDVQRPSFLETGLRIGAAGVDAYSGFRTNSRRWSE
jgi:hypothetical protein